MIDELDSAECSIGLFSVKSDWVAVLMRKCTIGLSFLFVAVLVLSLAGQSSAGSRILPAGSSFTYDLTVGEDGTVSANWDSSGEVSFVLRDPDGDILRDEIGTSGHVSLYVSTLGTYTLTWINNEATSVTLDYDAVLIPFDIPWDGNGFQEGFDAISLWVAVVIIGAVLVTSLIIIVLLVFVNEERKSETHPQAVPMMAHHMTPTMKGTCPACGTSVDTNMQFCSRCGTRFK